MIDLLGISKALWKERFGDEPGQSCDEGSLSLGMEFLPDLRFESVVLRFGPQGDLSMHVSSPPLPDS